MNIFQYIYEAITGPGSGRINRDLRLLDEELLEYKKGLVDIADHEMKDLSDHQLDSSRSRRSKISKALISTVFNEAALCYGLKKYRRSGRNGVVLAYTRGHEYILRLKEKMTSVFVDRQFIGYLNNRGQISKGKSRRILAEVETSGEMRMIRVENRDVASLNYEAHDSKKVLKRVLNFTQTTTDIERQIVIVYYLLTVLKKHEL